MEFYKSRMLGIQSPLIPVISELISENPETISLGQGVVYYGPPPEAIEYLTKFLADPNNHKYQSVLGISPLLEAIETKLAIDNKIQIDDDNCIVVTAGGNMAFINAILSITNAGDEIILQTPYYFNHEMAIKMANCQPICVETDDNYQLRPAAIEAAITKKTRAIVTISPNNPTGVVYSENSLRQINEICQKWGLYHINDEAYEYFTYGSAKHISPASFSNSSYHTISLYSLSKAYGFASWRIGYMVIPKHLLTSVKKVQDTILICPPVISQYAALGALQVGVNYCKKHLQTIAKTRKIVWKSLQSIQDICNVVPGDGAFYFFLKIHTQINSLDLVKKLIKKHGVAAIPGTTFGTEKGCYLRIAYGALQPEIASVGIEKLVQALRQIVG
jgi:aspartate/methionine/tyrosine aminotransferase